MYFPQSFLKRTQIQSRIGFWPCETLSREPNQAYPDHDLQNCELINGCYERKRRRKDGRIEQLWGRFLCPFQGIYVNNISEFCGNSHRWRLVTSDWAQDSWTTSLLTHPQPTRGRSHALQPLPQIFPIKTSPWKSSASSRFLSTSHPFLHGLAVNLSLLQTPTFWFVWPECASGTPTWVQQQY